MGAGPRTPGAVERLETGEPGEVSMVLVWGVGVKRRFWWEFLPFVWEIVGRLFGEMLPFFWVNLPLLCVFLGERDLGDCSF